MLAIQGFINMPLEKISRLDFRQFIRDLGLQGLKVLACAEVSRQILGRQLFSTWIWSPSQVSSFVTEQLGEERWVEVPADRLLAVYNLQLQGSRNKAKGHVAVSPVLENCKEPPALGFQGHSGPPSSSDAVQISLPCERS